MGSRSHSSTGRRRETAQGDDDAEANERTHSEIQAWLRDLGHALGYDVWIAANDQSRLVDGKPLSTGCCRELPTEYARGEGIDAVRLIDVLWLDRSTGRITADFEVEHSTSIYSGIVRLLDLALGVRIMRSTRCFSSRRMSAKTRYAHSCSVPPTVALRECR